jgi:hypothetical protein
VRPASRVSSSSRSHHEHRETRSNGQTGDYACSEVSIDVDDDVGVVPTDVTCTNCFTLGTYTTQNLFFSTANRMQRAQWLANITVCETGVPAGPGDLLLLRLCNAATPDTIDFTVTSVEVIWN